MIKSLLKLALFLVVGILAYNYFLGTPEEKESTKQVLSGVKEVGKSVGNLLKAEREKFREGKYDEALEKIGNAFENLKSKAQDSGDMLDRIKKLEQKKEELQKQLSNEELSEEDREQMKQELEQLIEDTESLQEEVEQQ